MPEKLYEEKTMIKGGARHHFIKMNGEDSYKYHRYDGPAIEPLNKNSEYKKEYYLGGIRYDVEEYKELMKQREGLPWYKQSGNNVRH